MALREILAKFGIEFDGKALHEGNKEVESGIQKLKEFGETALEAFGVEQIVEFTKDLIEESDQLSKTAQALGATTEELEGLEYAGRLSGVSADELRNALARLQYGAGQLTSGSGLTPVQLAFKKLGVEMKDSSGQLKSTGTLFIDAAEKIAGLKNSTEAAGIAQALFGRSYAPLIPLLKRGKEGIHELTSEIDDLGFGLDKAFIENSAEFDDNVFRLKEGLKGLAITAIRPLLPDLVSLAKQGVELAKWLVKVAKEGEPVTAFFYTVGGALILSAIANVGKLLEVFEALSGVLFRFGVPFLLIEDFLTFMAGGKSVIGDLITHVFGKDAANNVRAFFESIKHWFGEMDKAGKTLAGGLVALSAVIGSRLLSALVKIPAAAEKAGEGVASAGAAAKGSSGFFSALALDIGAAAAAYQQWQQLSSETGGLGVVGALKRSLQRGKGIFEAIDSKEDEDAKKRRAQQDANDDYNEKHPAGEEHGRRGVTVVRHLRGRRGAPRAEVAAEAPAAPPPEWLGAVINAIPKSATATAPVVNNVHNTTHLENRPNITVTVAPGTSRQQARELGNAAEEGTRRGLDGLDFRATQAALVPTAG